MPSGGNSDEYAYKEDIEWDAFSLNYIDKSTGVAYSQNLLMNPDCNCDRIGATPGWSVNQGGVLTNPTFDGFDFPVLKTATVPLPMKTASFPLRIKISNM